MKKRILLGHCTILSSVIIGILGTFLLDYLEQYTKHIERLEVIFGIGGGALGFASLVVALVLYTDNLGEGLK